MKTWVFADGVAGVCHVASARMDYESRIKCNDCGAHSGPDDENHSPFCKAASVEFKANQMTAYYEAWLHEKGANTNRIKQLKHEVAQWQAKHATLRHENNKLRRKLFPTTALVQEKALAEATEALK